MILAEHRQHTLKNAISCTGIGLHSGSRINMTLRPAQPNTGIVFRRTDLGESVREIPALWSAVTDTTLCTAVGGADGVKIATVEHLMAALSGGGVDNVVVEVDGPEVPIMDGSAAPFVFLIDCAGRIAQPAARRHIRVLKKIHVVDGKRSATLFPSDGFSVSVELDFNSRAIAKTSGYFDLCNGGFRREICRARTFGFEQDVDRLVELGLARGGSLDNAIVIGRDDVILNEGGLRYGDEFVRHKVLDAVGDLYMAGAPLLAHYVGVRSGHQMNNLVLHALFADDSAWEYDLVPAHDHDSEPGEAYGSRSERLRAIA